MGRRKLPIRKIDEPSRLQITYSKRKHGLIKKIYEMSVLTDVDVAFISFSQAKRLSFFSGTKRIEDVFKQYTDSPVFQKNHNLVEQEQILGALDSIRKQTDARLSSNAEIRALEQEVQMKEEELMRANAEIKKFEIDDSETIETLEEIEAQEQFLINALQRFSQRKMFLTETCSGPGGPLINQNHHPQSERWYVKPNDNTPRYQYEAQQTARPAEMNWMHQTQQTAGPAGMNWVHQTPQTAGPAEMNWMYQNHGSENYTTSFRRGIEHGDDLSINNYFY